MKKNVAPLNEAAPVIFMQGEETAGSVGDLLRKDILDELRIAYDNYDVSVANRILSEGRAVTESTEAVKHHKKATLVKEPGVTPRPDQLLEAVAKLETEGRLRFDSDAQNQKLQELRDTYHPMQSEEGMARFAYALVGAEKPIKNYNGIKGLDFKKGKGLIDASGSPNAIWRKVLGATLLRGVSPLLEENSTAKTPEWSADTAIRVIARKKDDHNTEVSSVDAGKYKVIFESTSEGKTKEIGRMDIEGNATPMRLSGDSETEFKTWFKEQLATVGSDAEIMHALKQTVISTDYAYIEWMDEVLKEQSRTNQIAKIAQDGHDPSKLNIKFLADNAIGSLASYPPKKETVMFSPNPSYGEYVEMMQGIREAGGFKPATNSEVIRAAATKDHYARVEYRAEEAGTLKIINASTGDVVMQRHMEANDIAIATNFDRARVAILVKQSLDHAVSSGKTTVLFGFDKDDAYYGAAVEELNKIRDQDKYKNLNIIVGGDKEMTVKYYSQGNSDTLLTLGNIQGDFATDVELAGKGTSYSKALLADGRMAIETGSLGTAPDLTHDPSKSFGWKKDGVLIYNPMAFIEAYSYALEGVAQNMGDDTLIQKTAKALESAVYKTTQKGFILPISKGTLKQTGGATETKVGTHTFVKHVLLETLKGLEGEHPSATSENIARVGREFKQQLIVDTAIFKILDAKDERSNQWKEANWKVNTMLTQAGVIDTDHPDYSIKLPADTDYSKLNDTTLFNLRMAQAQLVEAIENGAIGQSMDEAKNALVEAYAQIGINRPAVTRAAGPIDTLQKTAEKACCSRTAVA